MPHYSVFLSTCQPRLWVRRLPRHLKRAPYRVAAMWLVCGLYVAPLRKGVPVSTFWTFSPLAPYSLLPSANCNQFA